MEERLKYLNKASQILPYTGELQKVKSHLSYMCDKFLQYEDITKKNLPLTYCSHCFMEYRGTQYSVQVIPSKKPSRKLQRALVKEATSQLLTGVEKLLLLNYKETRGKKLVIKCAICQKETDICLKRQKRERRKIQSVDATGNPDNFKTSKTPNKPQSQQKRPLQHPKKNKKKDHFAGLKAAAVMSVKSKKRV